MLSLASLWWQTVLRRATKSMPKHKSTTVSSQHVQCQRPGKALIKVFAKLHLETN